jgi:hypothetical protein
MSIPTRCPGCNELYQLADKLAGKKVRCKKCQEILTVPDSDSSPTYQIQSGPGRPKSAAAPVREQRRPARLERDEDEWEEPRPRSVRRNNHGLLIGLGVGCLALGLLLAGGGIIAVVLLTTDAEPKESANVAEKPFAAPPPVVDPGPERPMAPVHRPGGDAVTEAMASLNSHELGQRMMALTQLQHMRPNERRPEVARALEALLNDPDLFVRKHAVDALAVWGSKENVPALIQILNESKDFQATLVRHAAIEALGGFKDERAAEPLAACLEELHDRHSAGKALQKLGPAAEKAVLQRLTHHDWQVRMAACEALQAIGTKNSLADLEKVSAENHPLVTRKAREAIQAIKRRGG